jgi:hypothetical protein
MLSIAFCRVVLTASLSVAINKWEYPPGPRGWPELRCNPDGDRITIAVGSPRMEDDGCGMDGVTLAHVCDPLFTTKFTGRIADSAAVWGIVRGHKVWCSCSAARTGYRLQEPVGGSDQALGNIHENGDKSCRR